MIRAVCRVCLADKGGISLHILGLQKLTLLDYPGKVACTIFLGGCNFRCPFCHNRPLVVNPDFSAAIAQENVLAFLEKRRGVLDGVCITGGEPLLSDSIFNFAHTIKQMGFEVKVDTNGCFPERLEKLIASGDADYVAMDIKNSPSHYAQTAGLDSLDLAPIKKSVQLLLRGTVSYEFRTTVVRELHTKEDFEEIALWIAGAKQYFLQNFVDSGALIQDGYHACSEAEMRGFCNILRPSVPSVAIRGL